jgi:hypothetical protein
MPQIAILIEHAMSVFGPSYPRDRDARCEKLIAIHDASDNDDGAFGNLDDSFFALIESENGGFETTADAYAAANEYQFAPADGAPRRL